MSRCRASNAKLQQRLVELEKNEAERLRRESQKVKELQQREALLARKSEELQRRESLTQQVEQQVVSFRQKVKELQQQEALLARKSAELQRRESSTQQQVTALEQEKNAFRQQIGSIQQDQLVLQERENALQERENALQEHESILQQHQNSLLEQERMINICVEKLHEDNTKLEERSELLTQQENQRRIHDEDLVQSLQHQLFITEEKLKSTQQDVEQLQFIEHELEQDAIAQLEIFKCKQNVDSDDDSTHDRTVQTKAGAGKQMLQKKPAKRKKPVEQYNNNSYDHVHEQGRLVVASPPLPDSCDINLGDWNHLDNDGRFSLKLALNLKWKNILASGGKECLGHRPC